ncbi:hypothetical protein [Bacteroides sp.]|uniref:hypothetical protein n=1 Tax=Bacteroides sp. TaxID=29523 RepID=UPI0025873C27|nr:hypothetical protein [Bacteroides sp.]
MKKILFILFVAQFILAPYIIKGYGANLVEDNYEYSGVSGFPWLASFLLSV